MNLRSTAWLFAVMFTMLWLFGLMLAFKKNPLDRAYVVPTLQQKGRDYDIVAITVKRAAQTGKEAREAQEFQFTQESDVWRLKDPASNQAVKVEGFRVNNIVNDVKNARKDDEADVPSSLSLAGLESPQATITLRGKLKAKLPEAKEEDKDGKAKQEEKQEPPLKEKDWTFYLGKESPDKKFVYVNSSDEPNRVFAVAKSSLDSLFFADANHLRSKTFFTFTDATAKAIEIKQGKDELELKKGDDKKGDDNLWRFVKPDLGIADFEGPPAAKDPLAPKDLPPPPGKAFEGGVKGLLTALMALRVDSDGDFVAMDKDNLSKYQLEDGKEALRIQVSTPDFKKDINKETLLVGTKVREHYYARVANDDGVFKLKEATLKPVLEALKNPRNLRSLDVGQFDPKTIDAVTLKQGKDETRLWHPEDKPWQAQIGADKAKKANEPAITKLIDTMLGKRQIKEFLDSADTDVKKLDADRGLDAPTLEIALYANGLERKDEAKKDDKKEEKKEEKKESNPEDGFNLKKDYKPALTLRFGKADKDTVAVQRVTADGLVSRFVVPKAMLDAAAPPEGALAFLDPALPSFEPGEVARLEVQRGGKKVELGKGTGSNAARWIVKEGTAKADEHLADAIKTDQLFRSISSLSAKRWVKRLDAKEKLDEYGLDKPGVTATVTVMKQRITAAGAATALAMLSAPVEARLFAAAGALAANLETVTIQFGKESKEKDIYAKHSGSELLFTVPADTVRMLREVDLRDKSMLLITQHILGAAAATTPLLQPMSGLTAGAPVNTGLVVDLDPAKIKEIRLALRSPFELRELAFQRKDKSWVESSGLKDFNLDPDKVEQVAKDFGRLQADRLVNLTGGAKADQKVGPKDFTVKLDLTTEDGKTTTLTFGATLERAGHFATTTNWPDAVFLVSDDKVRPLRSGVAHFAKERSVAE